VKLYSGPVSLFTAKVRIALNEKELPYERVEVGWSPQDRYLPHHPDVVALNPKAEVPVLVDGDLVLYDSTLILEYLEDRHPQPPLYPSDAAERARCRLLEATADEILFQPLWTLIDRVFYPGSSESVSSQDAGAEDPEVLEARRQIAHHHHEFEKQLVGREYLCGEYSVADIASFVMLSAAAQFGSPPGAEHSELLGWFGRVAARPAVKKDAEAMVAFVASLS
jgi:glutathione S-transferase